MDYLSLSNSSNETNQQCSPTENENLWHFLNCLIHFVLSSRIKSFCVITFALGTVVMNICVIVYLNRFRKSKTVFDKIFIAHAFVDLLIGKLNKQNDNPKLISNYSLK